MAEAPGGGQQGGGQGGAAPQFNPVEARTYLQTFGHDVTAIDDAKLPEVYTKVKTGADTYVTGAIDKAIKERGEFGPQWRQAIAGDDADALKTLERFQTPKEIYKSFTELRTKVSKGELKAVTAFPDKGTADEQAAWRKEQGLPDKPEGYAIKPPEGVVIGDEDQPQLQAFLKHAHANNLPQSAVDANIAFWAETRIQRQESAAQALAESKKQTEDTLRAEMGTEYRPAMNRIEGVLDANLPAGSKLRDKILTEVGSNVDFARLMAALAFQTNPTGTLAGNNDESRLTSITDWLGKADKLMRTNRKEYDRTMANEYTKYAAAYQKQSGKEWGKK